MFDLGVDIVMFVDGEDDFVLLDMCLWMVML